MERPAPSLARPIRQIARPLAAAGLALACLAAPAFAADLAPPAPPVFTWSGLYVGLNAGYAWPNSLPFSTSAANVADSPAFPHLAGLLPVIPHLWGAASAVGAAGSIGTHLNGFFSGGQLGYNWQFAERWVAGLGADIDAGGIRGGGGFTNLSPAAVFPPFVVATSVGVNRTLEYLGTVRGRLGYAITPTIMLYATGGLAYGGISTSTTVRQSLTPSLFTSAAAESDFFDNRIGWTVGGGVESALTGEISAKLEALYYNLGVANTHGAPLFHTAIVGAGAVGDVISSSTRFQGFVFRGGLNYRFDGSAPTATGTPPLFTAPQFVAAEKPAFGDWHLTIMPYVWALDLNGTTTAKGETVGANLSFVDLLTKTSAPPLEAAALIEARNGPFGVYVDYVWAQLRASGSILANRTPVTGLLLAADGTGHLTVTMRAILEAGASYELLRWGNGGPANTAIDAIAGLRYWNMTTDVGLDITGTVNVPLLGLSQVGQRAVANSGDLNWVDPLVGLRVRKELASGDEFRLQGDIGGFGAGSKISWQAIGGYVHNFQLYGINWAAMIGYRALEVDYSQGSGDAQRGINIVMHGPIVGVGLRF